MHKYLLKLFSHFTNDFCMLHVVVHMGCDSSFASRAVDEELDEIQERWVSVLLVLLNPVIHHNLRSHLGYNRRISNTNHSQLTLFFLIWQFQTDCPRLQPQAVSASLSLYVAFWLLPVKRIEIRKNRRLRTYVSLWRPLDPRPESLSLLIIGVCFIIRTERRRKKFHILETSQCLYAPS